MSTYFLDSSTLIKAHRREDGTARVTGLLNGTDPLIIARLAQVEVTSAIVRRGRAGGMAAQEIDAVLAQLDLEIDELFAVVELTPAIMQRSSRLTRAHAIRAADAIQLACALLVRDEAPQQELVLVGSDAELNRPQPQRVC